MNSNFELLGTRPALTMSVPVRYSAAANYAVAASGLSNTLQQEEQHHQQQQATPFQLFQQHQPAQQHQLPFSSFNSYGHGLEQQHQQQQLMQQRSSMSSSVSVSGTSSSSSPSPSALLPIIRPVNPIITVVSGKQAKNKKRNNNNKNKKMMMQQQQQQQKQKHHHPKQQQQQQQQKHAKQQQQQKPKQQGSGQSIIPASALKSTMSGRNGCVAGGARHDDDDMKPTTSAMAAAARAARATAAAAAVQASAATAALPLAVAEGANAITAAAADAEMRTEWMRMSAEGRYGDPDAAGLNYAKNSAPLGDAELAGASASCQATATNDQPMDNEMTSGDPAGAAASHAVADDNAMDASNDTPAFSHHTVDRLNAMTSDELYGMLKEYDVLQDKYHTVLLLPKESRREVTAGGRDGSAYVLRCLKMWYELPSDVLFSAMSLVDRFLDRMAVKPKHMACMSVASFHLAIKQLDLKPIPADDLVTISQCGCTPGDLERMAGVIANKLGVHLGTGQAPITSVSYLRVYYGLFRNMAKEIGGQFFEFFEQLIKLEDLENRLEILLCDVKTTVITPSTLALVLICLHLDFHIKESYTRGSPELKHVFEYILFLQQYMRIPDRVFTCGFSIVSGILSHYNGQNKQPYKQRLVWKLSSRTLRVLRPTNRFSSDLPTIEEGIPNAMDDGLRSRTESISSEEEEDWPTSPIIPIFEQC